ncbi:hypothetical protein BPTFM16_00571 [Altererythrobacter insulae]|nr:hypothetical protein BPTFM16_00571 [Altererythrobacter insulae]
MKKAVHPVVRAFGIFFVCIGLPSLIAIAWWKAVTFDPYTQSFFTKQWVEPTPDMPGQMRIAGWVFIGLGALLAIEPAVIVALEKRKLKQAFLMVWIGGLVSAFGGAFFLAANSAQAKIDERSSVSVAVTKGTAA